MSEENKVVELKPRSGSTLRSKLFGLLGIALMLAGASLGYKNYQYYKAGQPYLLGTCWQLPNEVTMSIVETPKVQTPEGKTKAYAALVRLGPFAFPQLLKIREANALFAELKAKGQAVEINCMSGEPVDAKPKTE